MRTVRGKRQEPTFRQPQIELPFDEPPKKKPLKMLMDLRPEAQKRRPGPSKTVYRIHRIWKKQWVRRLAIVVLPLTVLGAAGYTLATDPSVQRYAKDLHIEVLQALSDRPEFAVRGVRIRGASPVLADRIRRAANVRSGMSSLALNVAFVHDRLAEMGGVRRVEVVLGHDAVLDIAVIERLPAAVWRDEEGGLWLIGRDGVAIAQTESRIAHRSLPLVLGAGGGSGVPEALKIYRTAPDLRDRLRALVRVGQRRWNVVLDRGLTIMLPEQVPERSLARVMAWHYGEELLDRALMTVDMRNVDRPVLRMTPRAAEKYREDLIITQEGEET
ncbi:MAG: cell division protein FtsQ/DivIB [Pseudomonadota bacterium]